MAVVEQTVSLDATTVARIQEELRERALDGWLLWDFHGLNAVAGRLLGLPALSRRYLVLIPAAGQPVALTHRIEQQPWSGWIGEQRVYLGWREFEASLRDMLAGARRVAMEYEPENAVPYGDRVPAGVLELVRRAGVEVASSAELVTVFYSRWSAEQEASHRRAAVIVQETAQRAFTRIGERVRRGEEITARELREWICAELRRRGLAVGADATVAVGADAANPHYCPTPEQPGPIRRDAVILIDLWGKEAENAIYADQTWMGYVGEELAPRLREIWSAVRDGRDAAVALLHARWAGGEPVTGGEVDDAARSLISERGFGAHFLHRTGHSIDRELHGSGPNIDNLETRDHRRLIPGVGFSIEPGIYLPGEVGFRSEINVFVSADGPQVTTPDPQRDVLCILRAAGV